MEGETKIETIQNTSKYTIATVIVSWLMCLTFSNILWIIFVESMDDYPSNFLSLSRLLRDR